MVAATRYFQSRVSHFISKILRQKSNPLSVQYYSYKVEFQERGAPHIHGVLWLDMNELENLSRIDGQLTKIEDGDEKPLLNLSKTFTKLRKSEKLEDEDKSRLTCFIDNFITVSLHANTVGEDVALIAKTVNEHKCSKTCFKKGDFADSTIQNHQVHTPSLWSPPRVKIRRKDQNPLLKEHKSSKR